MVRHGQDTVGKRLFHSFTKISGNQGNIRLRTEVVEEFQEYPWHQGLTSHKMGVTLTSYLIFYSATKSYRLKCDCS
ncbi:hypothetical protein AB6A40_004720 [Gnathostoma spinigerum]|uniref:Uncharacterized protein n=1 Tax=Gnathostoma spinigerum TaxID=75299 RepID=A0ABD6EKS0_9BILA